MEDGATSAKSAGGAAYANMEEGARTACAGDERPSCWPPWVARDGAPPGLVRQKVVPPVGLEPTANGLKVHRSVQLSYEGRCGCVSGNPFFTTHPSWMPGSEIQTLPRL